MKNINLKFLIIALLCFWQNVNCARILFVVPSPSVSHHLFFRPIIRELSFRGHEVISISADPMNDPKLTNLTEIDVHKEAYAAFNIEDLMRDMQGGSKPKSFVEPLRNLSPSFWRLSHDILTSPQVQKLIKDPNEHFDLIINEMLLNAAYFGFKHRFNCPMIGIASLDTLLNGMDAIGNSPNPSYNTAYLGKSGANLSFWDRLENFFFVIDYRYFYYYEYLPSQQDIARKVFGNEIGDIWELEKSIDLLLVNTNPVFHIPRPHVPGYIEIGGMHEPKRIGLPQDLQKILDDAKEGVIYFSLGSNVKSVNLPESTRKSILNAFKQLPYKVLWKWENETIADQPKNVILRRWLPQPDVFGHKNIRAFITQGGLQSVEEAIQSKLPMIVIPFGGDQSFNGDRIATLGMGKVIRFNDITTENLVESVTEIVTNPSYKANVAKLSTEIWDQETKPLDRAIWWIEYVIRHGGAKHLRSPAVDLSWTQYLLLDVIGFLLGIVTIILVLASYIINTVLKFVSNRKIKTKKD